MLLKRNLIIEASIVLVIILFLEAFSLTLIPENSTILAAAVFGTGVFIMLFSFAQILFKKGYSISSLDKLVLLFIYSMFLSSLMAKIYWDQELLSSLLSYRSFYIYFLYFVFIFLKISPKRIERILIVLFVLSIVIFLIDYFTFPDPLFAYRSEERRDGITIFFYGQGFTFLGGFYFLNKFFNEKRIIHLIWFILAFICLFLLTQSRMNLVALAMGFLLLLLACNMKNKFIIILFIMITGVTFYYTSGVFEGIRKESQEQSQFYKEDVRVKAQGFFLTDLQGGIPTVLFGNGYPSGGSALDKETTIGMEKGFFTADVGLTGIFSFFGLFGTIIWLFFFHKAFTLKNNRNATYIKAYFLTLFTTAFAGFSIFEPGYMPATVLALYLMRCYMVPGMEQQKDWLETSK